MLSAGLGGSGSAGRGHARQGHLLLSGRRLLGHARAPLAAARRARTGLTRSRQALTQEGVAGVVVGARVRLRVQAVLRGTNAERRPLVADQPLGAVAGTLAAGPAEVLAQGAALVAGAVDVLDAPPGALVVARIAALALLTAVVVQAARHAGLLIFVAEGAGRAVGVGDAARLAGALDPMAVVVVAAAADPAAFLALPGARIAVLVGRAGAVVDALLEAAAVVPSAPVAALSGLTGVLRVAGAACQLTEPRLRVAELVVEAVVRPFASGTEVLLRPATVLGFGVHGVGTAIFGGRGVLALGGVLARCVGRGAGVRRPGVGKQRHARAFLAGLVRLAFLGPGALRRGGGVVLAVGGAATAGQQHQAGERNSVEWGGQETHGHHLTSA